GGRDKLCQSLPLPEEQRVAREVPDPRQVRHGGDQAGLKLRGRVIYGGDAEGDALVTSQAISFYGGVDPASGEVIERGHELQGECVKGRVLVFPNGKG